MGTGYDSRRDCYEIQSPWYKQKPTLTQHAKQVTTMSHMQLLYKNLELGFQQ